MADKWVALQRFWSSFGLPAYDENTVPSTATYPRLTYEAETSSFDEESILKASIWYNSTSWSEISQKANEISDFIGMGGTLIAYTDGSMWVKRGTPFAQRMSDPEPHLRRIVLSVEIEFFSE
jgi:hypothetical protein